MIGLSRQRSHGRRFALAAAILLGVSLAGCGSTSAAGGDAGPEILSECVPFARAVAEVQIHGNAADWWARAAGQYARTQAPSIGSVLVFRRTSRLPYGHVAVVSRVLSSRRILLTHANWVPHRINEDVLSIDVSPNNDWSQVRVWWPPLRQMGASIYPAYGFIQTSRPLAPDQIAANARRFIMVATQN
ncbi:MAG: CHAP domain-containing protein [Rhodospirillales bacterium]|nr:CHAP domain-containing protein [Rhodospirillales bacterium]